MTDRALLRGAATLHWSIAVGFGVFCFPATLNLMIGRAVPIVMGFPAYGQDPFEQVGLPTTIPLLATFLLVCMLEAWAGFLLWRGDKSGAVLALVLLPVGGVFWWGFALPIPPIFALVWTLLILRGWQTFRFSLPGMVAFGFGTVLWIIYLASRPRIDVWAAQKTPRTVVIPECSGPSTRFAGDAVCALHRAGLLSPGRLRWRGASHASARVRGWAGPPWSTTWSG